MRRVHDLGAAGDRGQRQPAGDALGGRDQVGHDALVVAGEPVAGAAKPVWISSATNTAPLSRHHSASAGRKPGSRDDEAALALDRLDHEAGDVVGADLLLDQVDARARAACSPVDARRSRNG